MQYHPNLEYHHGNHAELIGAGSYLHWGVVQISLANLLVIVLMVLVFAAAVAFRMPDSHPRRRSTPPEARHDDQ